MEYKTYYNYDIYPNGEVYSHYVKRFLKGEITKFGYIQYTLRIDGQIIRKKAHQLVAELFLEKPKQDNLVINHKDGNKLNNNVDNLEWVSIKENNRHAREMGLNNVSENNRKRWENKEWAEKVSEKISKTLKEKGTSSGQNNPRFRYLIYDKNNKLYSRIELAEHLGLSQSYTDTLIRKSATGQSISNKKFIEEGFYIIDTKNKG